MKMGVYTGAKGIVTKPFPKHWYRYNKIEETDSEELVDRKNLYNSILVDKKPYFFRYLYGTCKTEYSRFFNSFNSTIRLRLDMTLKELLSKKELTEEEQYYYDFYIRKSPLIYNDCEMNILCRYMERIDLDIKKVNKDNDIYKKYMTRDIDELDKKLYDKIKKIIETNKKMISEQIFDFSFRKRLGYSENELNIVSDFDEKLIEDLSEISNNFSELTDYMIYIFYVDKPSYNKDILWKLFGKYIYNHIHDNSNGKVKYPKISSNGNYSYMFDRYDIMEADIFGK